MSTVSRRAVTVLAAVGLACSANPAAAQTAPSFAQLTGEQGCLVPEGLPEDFDSVLPPGCASTPALASPNSLLVSPDGAQVYVVGSGFRLFGVNGVSVFARDRGSGALTLASCVTNNGGHGPVGSAGICADGDALSGASGFALGADGRDAYVTASNDSAVSWFTRDTSTGQLRQRGCIKQLVRPGERCGLAPALGGASDVAVGADGKHVYVAAERSGAVAVMNVDPVTGALTEQTCVSDSGSDGACARVPALAGADGLVLSPEGEYLYVTSSDTGALVILAVDGGSGDLSGKGCLLAHAPKGPCTSAPLIEDAQDAVVTADGRNLLVVASGKRALVNYERDASTGQLRQQQCFEHVDPQGADAVDEDLSEPPDVDAGCTAARALGEPNAIAASSDGRAVFTASSEDYLAAFQRDPTTGTLSQIACAEDDQTYKSCTEARGVSDSTALAASPDARNLYLASSDDVLSVFAASVAIASARASLSPEGTISVVLSCPAALREGCRGSLIARGVRGGRRYRLGPGHATRATVRVPSRAVRQLRRRGRARVTLVASDSRRPFGATSRLVTVRGRS
jgi:6-phosphogluconolactonase (cycloisomerase 2 family)